ncbi:MAG: tyrosine--tRNA ligase [candidate division KSB1 bacterium]|nr:tyrosine--tRNA ligase [candidate division KSB1 bacterium]MDZ7302089.1 tyrosine--tRNA ligase [candidate division KSB1 bacterium]MDZ7311130.1 tyrosine--tRNA ligase [candidate division KSB1 bacterium]
MTNVYDELSERGFIQQVSNEESLRNKLSKEKVTCYIGFDPTADSLHVGSLLPIMALVHMQRFGHKPIAILGGGTSMVGDPSGRTEMRQMLTREQIVANGEKIRQQLSRFLDFDGGRAIIIDNAEWLLKLNYIDFLRDIGRHFSVNRMLAAEAYKIRMEAGLSFIEFNYQVLQAYDYLMLYRRYGCTLQMGGNDQWGNILAGVDLIRRIEGAEVEALTFPLITTAGGQKMGKTAAGAVWLEAEKFSPYDFYQYWVNVDDRDVAPFLKYFTLLPLEAIRELASLQGADLRQAKAVLAYEVTKLVHGEAAAQQARGAAQALFGDGTSSEAVPQITMSAEKFRHGMNVIDLFVAAGLASSKSEARRLVTQGGAYVNKKRIQSLEEKIDLNDAQECMLLLRAGKKRYQKVVIRDDEGR